MDDLGAEQPEGNAGDQKSSDERTVLEGYSIWLHRAVISDACHRPVEVTELRRAAVLAETSGHVGREVTEAVRWRHVTALLRRTAQLRVMTRQIIEHLLNNDKRLLTSSSSTNFIATQVFKKLQGRCVSRVALVSILLLPVLCVAVWSTEQFRLQCA